MSTTFEVVGKLKSLAMCERVGTANFVPDITIILT